MPYAIVNVTKIFTCTVSLGYFGCFDTIKTVGRERNRDNLVVYLGKDGRFEILKHSVLMQFSHFIGKGNSLSAS